MGGRCASAHRVLRIAIRLMDALRTPIKRTKPISPYESKLSTCCRLIRSTR